MTEFRYLGFVVEAHGEVLKEVEDRIARAEPLVHCACLRTKRLAYGAMVMGWGALWGRGMGEQESCLESLNKCLRWTQQSLNPSL